MDVIRIHDGTLCNIENDTDFFRLLGDCLGDDAAEWFKRRIERVDGPVMEMRELFPPEEEMLYKTSHGTNVYHMEKLAELGMEKLSEIACIAYEIPGWDE